MAILWNPKSRHLPDPMPGEMVYVVADCGSGKLRINIKVDAVQDGKVLGKITSIRDMPPGKGIYELGAENLEIGQDYYFVRGCMRKDPEPTPPDTE